MGSMLASVPESASAWRFRVRDSKIGLRTSEGPRSNPREPLPIDFAIPLLLAQESERDSSRSGSRSRVGVVSRFFAPALADSREYAPSFSCSSPIGNRLCQNCVKTPTV
jgi:hypothetical protein